MKIVFDEKDADTVMEVAERYGVKIIPLSDMYKAVMASNFYEDLCDIARENEEELK